MPNVRLSHSLLFAAALACAVMCAACRQQYQGNERKSTGDKNRIARPPTASTRIRFDEVTEAAGITMTPRNGKEAGHRSILETLGTGVAIFDYDGDDDLDLFFPGGGLLHTDKRIEGLMPQLYRNDGDWRFTNVTRAAGFDKVPFYSHASVAADYDNDGHADLLVTGYRGILLYRNRGDQTFEEVGAASGLKGDRWSTSAAWGDFNADGILDLYVVNYVDWSFQNHRKCGRSKSTVDVCPPGDFEALSDRIYFGEPGGIFRDGTKEAGLKPGGKGLGVVASDVDLDGDLDIYVANDTTPNFLYRNNGNGKFDEIGIVSGTGLNELGEADGSMGVDAADYDLDGLPDLWVANYENQSFALYRNLGNCVFQHQSKSTGISATRGIYVGFGTLFFDADRDGDEDIFATNGHVMYHSQNSPYRQVPLLFENLKGKRFSNVGRHAGKYFVTPHVGRGAGSGDLDGDGRLDLVVTHSNEVVSLLKNTSLDRHYWLQLKLVGETSNRDAVGARIQIQSGGKNQTREVKAGSSYLSNCDKRVYFGLGKEDTIDLINIRWPSGKTTQLKSVKANQSITVREARPSTETR